ncbi:MAG TPA: thiamine phosphate synthase [Gemmatimonadales bacterium]|nr:thiamine phosphate synthase [Gemmatimonadales bacterium]
MSRGGRADGRTGGREVPRLHVVTDAAIARLPDLADRGRAVAAAGTVALHARGPELGGRALLDLARTLGAAAEHTTSRLFVNDRLDVARMVDAFGVHLPGAGFPIQDARRLLGPDVVIGRSVHSAEAARRAHVEGADYVFLGPIWETRSHSGTAPLGPGVISAAAPARVIAIGGITLARVPGCRAAGAFGVAVISAVWRASDPGGVVRAMLLSLKSETG